ncbi:MAG: bifunctional diaminohydroxyphosphoribosylaminopyrimidine deaminase/5-amino-6-(5-phosphoribosylamino)uracil reductase RibD [Saprospiraceae bacterium]|nr:MAG: riboflavin biosynthesis protein RibD [Bacteroidetes bacterium OLB9]MCO6463464.1 bifunctional diaminohydroxyphosphoribosylaminopyrimidine deaminase/5-amino-6-(5-phosphoribosylamino)uracil reductase RibD [Saprospiraceae bacterium]
MEATPEHEIFMQRCIDLAKRGFGTTRTNPMVGAMLVYEGTIIGEGYHQFYGLQHAEINAIESVKDSDKSLIKDSTLYVTLEPCSHFGKTPPCAHRIVTENIRQVVIGSVDPNPKVAGNGIKYLQHHGVSIIQSVLSEDCDALLDKFKANLSGLPYIMLKWAQSVDGLMAVAGKQVWLSNSLTRMLTHRQRSEYDAILIGKNTAIVDDPILDARYFNGAHPIRVVLDSMLSIPHEKKIFSDGHSTVVVNTLKQGKEGHITYLNIGKEDIKEMMKMIFNLGISSIIVEGGAEVLNSFVNAGLWHQAVVIRTRQDLGTGLKAPNVSGKLLANMQLKDDEIMYIKNTEIA